MVGRRSAAALWLLAVHAYAGSLAYAPAPVDNPLKGFVPYLRADTTFPHSLEWDYTRLSDVMTGPTNFNWAPFDAKLEAAAARGHQFFARFYLEWPGRKTGVPQYLIAAGLTVRTWTNTNTQPFPPALDHTPDYEDPRLRAALTNFIHALGRRYDGDPRIGFIGLGLLGTWGEWHDSPHDDWFASKTVQREVMDAYEAAFQRTRLVARYPAGSEDPRYADNRTRRFGYHDDSFAWATVHTGKPGDAWFFETRLRAARAMEKWRTQSVGGEVRPEVWSCLFNDPTCAPAGQEFDRCVAVTHASWLCNEGVFRGQVHGGARARALEAARRLGYELHVAEARLGPTPAPGKLALRLSVTNTGVAPFYYDWPVELGWLDRRGQIAATLKTGWKLSGILPGEPASVWQCEVDPGGLPRETLRLLLRAPNPLPKGVPLRFANREQDRDLEGWLTLGEIQLNGRAEFREDELGTGSGSAAPDPIQPGPAWEATNPLLPGADPHALVLGDTVWVYPTWSDGKGERFFAFSSADLKRWQRHGPVLDFGDVAWIKDDGQERHHAWAPSVLTRDGKYYFYYSVGPQDPTPSRIGVAVGDAPAGPFRDSGKPLLTGGNGFEAIDPMVFTDPKSGNCYLYAGGSAGARLRVFELNPDLVSFAREAPVETPPQFTEGAFMHYHDGRYYLSYSHGGWRHSSYSVHYATAAAPTGPWAYRGAILASDATRKGPGHHSFVRLPRTGEWRIFYHRWENQRGDGPYRGSRQVCCDAVEYDQNGLIRPIVMTGQAVPQTTGRLTNPPNP
jgi:hypothetical protein